MKKAPRTIDPSKLSKSCLELNPHLRPTSLERAASAILPKKKAGKRRREMNKTEARFLRFLETMWPDAERIDYEGITLRWPDGMRYTPDFVVWTRDGRSELYEVKGAYAWRQDVVKFRAARERWKLQFEFSFWQEIEGVWQKTR